MIDGRFKKMRLRARRASGLFADGSKDDSSWFKTLLTSCTSRAPVQRRSPSFSALLCSRVVQNMTYMYILSSSPLEFSFVL